MSARCSYIDWPQNRTEDRRAFLLTFPGACGGGRASKKHGVASGRIRRLNSGLPARRVGMRIKQRPVRDGPDGAGSHGHREVRLRERFSILAVPGIRPGRPADTSRGRCLVRPVRRRG